MFPCLQTVHEVLGVDVDVGVEHVEPLGQVLLHGVQVLVRPGEAPQLSLLHQLKGERVLLTANIIKSGHQSSAVEEQMIIVIQRLISNIFCSFLVFEDKPDNLLPVARSEVFRSASETFRSCSFCWSSSRKLFSKDSNSSVSGEGRLEPKLLLLELSSPSPSPTPVLNCGAAGTRSSMMWSSVIALGAGAGLWIIYNLERDFLNWVKCRNLTDGTGYLIMTWLGCFKWTGIRLNFNLK